MHEHLLSRAEGQWAAASTLVMVLCLLQLGQTRWLYIMLWMAKHGNGLVPPKNIITSAKRLRVT
jgi:hypothetical protein